MLCPAVAARAGGRRPGTPLDDELHLLTVHGVLHLLGYDHAEPAEEREMFRLQNELLDTWREQRLAGARRTRLAAVDAAVLDTVGLAAREPAGSADPFGRTSRRVPTGDPRKADRTWTRWTSCCCVVAAVLVPIAGLLAAADAAITMVSPARVEEIAREGRRGAAALLAITEDRPRYTNLLLLLRSGRRLTATVMVTAVALSAWGFQLWVGDASSSP